MQSTVTKPLRVLIVGGGIAGNALAFWLSKLRHNVTILERSSALRNTGLQLDLRDHGVEVLKRMGLDKKFDEKRAPERGMRIVNSSGSTMAIFPVKPPKAGASSQSFTSEWEIMRGDFVKILSDAATCNTDPGRGKVEYLFDTSIESLGKNEEGPDNKVEVKLSNGKIDNFDLIVGADGSGSRTRSLMLKSEGIEQDPFHQLDNLYIAYFNLHRPIEPGEGYEATMFMGTGGRGLMTRRQNPDFLQIYIGGQTKDPILRAVKRGDTKREKEVLGSIMRGTGYIVDEVVDRFDRADDFYLERMGLVKLDHWSKGRVVLLGDAAYCPSAMTGMGTTSALVGAYVLAGELSKTQDVKEALTNYETVYRPFMYKVTDGVLEGGGGFSFPTGRLGIGMMNLIVRVVGWLRVDIGRFASIRTINGWDLPEYPLLDNSVSTSQ